VLFRSPALFMADLHRAGVHLRKPPAFHRVGIPGSGGPDWLRNDFEFIVCATSGGKLPWSNNTAMGHPPKYGPGGPMSNRRKDGTRVRDDFGFTGHNDRGRKKNGEFKKATMRAPNGCKGGDIAPNRRSVFPKITNPGNVIRCKVGGGHLGSRIAHKNEAPFPEKLAAFFVCSFCPPGGSVCDPFCGSGTTAAVAIKHGRNAACFDIRENQIELTNARIAEAYL